jgi:lysophospholipase L1-like esterase
VAGSFVYTPAAGAVLNAGTHTLKADFTPADAANYTTTQASTTSLTVIKASLLIKANDQTRTYGTANPDFTASFLAKVNVVVLGSSTAAGSGVSAWSKSWVNLMVSRLNTDYPGVVNLTNLAVGGFTTYHILPTGSNNGNRPAVDSKRNITAALDLKPNLIIINMPSNDAISGYSSTETLNNFAIIINMARAAGVKVLLTGTQPRGDVSSITMRQVLYSQNLSLLSIYGTDCINIYDELTDFVTYNIKPQYSYGDNIHVNDAGHAYIYSQMIIPVKRWIDTSNSGFVNNENVSSLNGRLTFTTSATLSSPAGSYSITASGLSSSNYQLSYAIGVLTITNTASSTARLGVEVESTEEAHLAMTTFPNPFSEQLTINFQSIGGQVTMELYNLQGMLIKQLYKGKVANRTEMQVKISGNGMEPGIYLLRLRVGDQVNQQKVVLTK